jgi:predicted small lipoprotein YifL
MRTPFVIALRVALSVGTAGCGQKGPLVKPSRRPTSPVVIRAPGTPAANAP